MTNLPNLLLVDDTQVNLSLLVGITRKLKVNLILAFSGSEALDKTRGTELALAIIDVSMPEMNGYELARKINSGRTGSKVPIIFLTAYLFSETEVFRGYDSGAVDYIFKPFNKKILLSKIKVFLDLFDQKQTILRSERLLKESTDELIRVNAAIKKSEADFHNIFDHSPVGSAIVGLDKCFKKCNSAFCNFLGYSERELTGKTVAAITHPEDRKIGMMELKELMEGKTESFKRQKRYIRSDGTIIWGEVKATLVFDAEAKPLYCLLIVHDITERKRSEEKLRELNEELEDRVNERTVQLLKSNAAIQQTHQNYETFFNTIDEFLFVLNEQGNIIHANSTVFDRLGYTRKELYGKSVLTLHPPERHEEAGRIMNEMFRQQAEFCPVPIMTKSGIQIPVETKVSYGFWDGKPVFFGVAKDISKIRLSEEKFSKLFYLNPSACSLTDFEDNNYIEVNEAFCTLLGYEINDVIGKSVTELNILSPETADIILKKIGINGSLKNVETELRAKNGDRKHLILSSECITMQDKIYRLTVAHDITKRKQAEEALKESETTLTKAQQIAHIGSWALDEPTHELWWSDETFRIFGYVPGACKPTLELFSQSVHPEDQVLVQEAITTAWDQRSSYSVDHRIILPDGLERVVHEQAEVIYNEGGQPKKWLGTVQDITEKQQIQKDIVKAIIQTEEKERAYFSKELHDGLGPLLSTIKLYLQWFERPKSNKSQEEIIQKAKDILEDALTAVKEISNKLSPQLLKNYGLSPAVQSFVDQLEATSEVSISFQTNTNRRLGVEIESAVYRAVIECITNSIKHARANNIVIKMNDYENQLNIQYTDDGIGFDLIEALSAQKGLGLFNLQKRIETIGGKIKMFSEPGKGVDYQIVVNL